MSACGFVASCSRPAGHRGQHGGFRSTVTAVEPQPGCDVRSVITASELRVIAEVLLHGDERQAAACAGLAYQSVKNYVSRVLHKTGAQSTTQLPWVLGWLSLPAGTYHATGAVA